VLFIPLKTIKNTLEETGRYWIVFTGDSLTSCEWVHPNWRDIIIYVLRNSLSDLGADEAWWGVKGFNLGYDGANTKDIVEKLPDILLVKPQLLVGLMGGNDPVLGVSPEESVKNISSIADTVVNSGAEVVWASSTPAGKDSKKNVEYLPYSEALLKLPTKEHFHKIDMFNIYQRFDTAKFFTFISEEIPAEGIKQGDRDLQHPNQLGNAYIAKVVLKETFGIEFDPEKYISGTVEGLKYPQY
jgi:hypothetical protein